jgi:hypothetical protein
MSGPEIIDISKMESNNVKLDDTPIHLSSDDDSSKKSVNFNIGLDMLMNTKTHNKSSGSGSDSLDDLEKDLNDLTDDLTSDSKPSISLGTAFTSSLDTHGSGSSSPEPIKLNISEDLGKSTSKSTGVDSTWDGYKKFNDIPVEPNKPVEKEPPMTKQQIYKEKFKYLRKLHALQERGIRLSKDYTTDNSLDEMKAEYESLYEEREKKNSVKFQKELLTTCISGLEWLNGKVDPFDIKLDGWSDQVNENIDSYEDIFDELHDKYKGVNMAPELRLLFGIVGSAVTVHITNSAMAKLGPGIENFLQQNPDMMRQFTNSAASAMQQEAMQGGQTGFGNFMGDLMGGQSAPQKTRTQRSTNPIPARPEIIPPQSHNTRPDIGMSRGQPDFDDAENMESGGSYMRQEMKGPSDLNDILSGLKAKNPALQSERSSLNSVKHVQTRPSGPKSKPGRKPKDTGSTISIEELQLSSKDADNFPKKSKRRPRSERNTVSLDI